MSVALPPLPWRLDDDREEGDDLTILDAAGFYVASVDATAILADYGTFGFHHWADAPGISHIERDEATVLAVGNLLVRAPELHQAASDFIAHIDADWNLSDGDLERLARVRAALGVAS